jgi:hypothetical protein
MRPPQSFTELGSFIDAPFVASTHANLRPFWAVVNDKTIVEGEKEDAILDWLNLAIDTILGWKYPITRLQRGNIKLYKGIHYMTQEVFESLPYNKGRVYDKNNAKIVVNKLQLLADQHVADAISYSPDVLIVPTHSEERDKVAARQNQGLLDYHDYKYDMQQKWIKFHQRKKICGTTFMLNLWNEEMGDLDPKYVAYRKMIEEQGGDPFAPMPLVDDEGNQITGQDGDPLFTDQAIRVGDVDCVLEFDERMIYETPDSGEWDDVPWISRIMYMDLDEVKARWPHKWQEIEAGWGRGPQEITASVHAQYSPQPSQSLTQKIPVRYFWHKPTPFLDRGFYCVSVREALLEAHDYPYKHGKLPVIRGTDIDVPGQIWGMSFFQNLAALQFAINSQASMFLQDQITMTYPKIVVPRGARVRSIKLGDDRDIYEYSGPKPPEIMAKNPTPTQSWQYYQLMNDELKFLSAVFGQSVGAPPNGITANVALRMLDEQEQKLRGPALKKNENYYIECARQRMSLFGTFYKKDDGRLARILGTEDSYTLNQFDIANLSTPYEVLAKKVSGLPKSPAAKIQTVLDIADRFPEMWKSDEVLEQLDMARPEKLIESATVARQTAEAEVEAILQGKMDKVVPPQMSDDILPKYKIYMKAVQPLSFKIGVPPERRQAMLQHIMTAEYIIWCKIRMNPTFQQMVLTDAPNFPSFLPQPSPDNDPIMLNMPSMTMGAGAPGAINSPDLGGLPPEAASGAPGPSPQATPPQASDNLPQAEGPQLP